MKVGKPKSKRVPVRLRHKIEKASTAKQRKERKEAKKNPQWRSRLKKDPGIPNLFPYKAKILAEIEESKRRKEEEQMQKRELAKARREGRSVGGASSADAAVAGDADEFLDDDDEEDELIDDAEDDDDEEMEDDGANPMAALLASAQARAQTFPTNDDQESENDDDEEGENDEWSGLQEKKKVAQSIQSKKALPKQALEDPAKGISLLMERMQKTQNGVQTLLDHYQLPPLVTARSDIATGFLVEVARKRGRLGRGGIPNLHAAALIVLNDLNEERLILPAVETQKRTSATGKGEVTIVKAMAAPFKLDGLWGVEDDKTAADGAMAVE